MFAVLGFFLKCNTVLLTRLLLFVIDDNGELDNNLLEVDGSVHMLLMGVESWKECMMFIFRTSDIAIAANEPNDGFIKDIIVD